MPTTSMASITTTTGMVMKTAIRINHTTTIAARPGSLWVWKIILPAGSAFLPSLFFWVSAMKASCHPKSRF